MGGAKRNSQQNGTNETETETETTQRPQVFYSCIEMVGRKTDEKELEQQREGSGRARTRTALQDEEYGILQAAACADPWSEQGA